MIVVLDYNIFCLSLILLYLFDFCEIYCIFVLLCLYGYSVDYIRL